MKQPAKSAAKHSALKSKIEGGTENPFAAKYRKTLEGRAEGREAGKIMSEIHPSLRRKNK